MISRFDKWLCCNQRHLKGLVAKSPACDCELQLTTQTEIERSTSYSRFGWNSDNGQQFFLAPPTSAMMKRCIILGSSGHGTVHVAIIIMAIMTPMNPAGSRGLLLDDDAVDDVVVVVICHESWWLWYSWWFWFFWCTVAYHQVFVGPVDYFLWFQIGVSLPNQIRLCGTFSDSFTGTCQVFAAQKFQHQRWIAVFEALNLNTKKTFGHEFSGWIEEIRPETISNVDQSPIQSQHLEK